MGDSVPMDADPRESRVPVDTQTLTTTRRSLHGVAELLLAGPEHRAIGRIRLQVAPGGFRTLELPGSPSRVAVEGTELLVVAATGDVLRLALGGTIRQLAAAAGVEAGAPQGVYHDGSGVGLDDEVAVDAAAAATIETALGLGDEALRRLAAAHGRTGDDAAPVLWPEHFDVGVTLDEVNYGVSPGDAGIAEPYAYVGPWQKRTGEFWDQPFGSARTVLELGDADALLDYFETGFARALEDPPA
jgi:hypothetical protein